MAVQLLDLSHEILHGVLIEVEPSDLINLMLTCKGLNHYIDGNSLLHRDIYARNWDMPADSAEWETEVRSIIKLGKILESTNAEAKESNIAFVAKRVQSLLHTASIDPDESININMLTDHFRDFNNIDALMTSSQIFQRAGSHPHRAQPSLEERQASAKLHCQYGVMITQLKNRGDQALGPSAGTRSRSEEHKIHAYARARVYDLREYTEKTLWGPFMPDGSQSVDWEKVEAILVDLSYSITKTHCRTHGNFPIFWNTPFAGITPNSFVEDSLEEELSDEDEDDDDDDESMDGNAVQISGINPSLEQLDPYGVTGTWMRVVCFLDYNDLYSYNFMNDMGFGELRPPIDTEEAIRLIRIKWRVTKVDPPGSDPKEEVGMDWSNFKGTRLPIVHFEGTSKSVLARFDPNANSRIRGTVRQTPEGEIRWTTFSIFGGEERWRSESVQIGGLRSARGVVGNWFDKDFSELGPAGPTAFWKESDTYTEERVPTQHWPFH